MRSRRRFLALASVLPITSCGYHVAGKADLVPKHVNTIENLSQGILSAALEVRMSPHAELVRIDIVKRSITVPLV